MDAKLPSGEDKTAMVRAMFDRIASRYDLINGLISFGLDRRWRERAVRSLLLAPGSVVLDLGCGTGDLASAARQLGQESVGIDLSFGMLSQARRSLTCLAQGDASQLPIASASVDGVLSGFTLRNFADLQAVWSEMARVLRPGGRLVLLEVDRPRSPLLAFGHRAWLLHAVPKLGAWLSDSAAYHYLPRSLAYLPTHDELARSLSASGFGSVRRAGLVGGVAQIVTATLQGQTSLLKSSE